MKKILTLAVAVLLTFGVSAQSIQETVAAIGEINVPACSVSLQKDQKVVSGAMEQYFKECGLKAKNQLGWLSALQQVVPTVSQSPINLYTKVEKQKKGSLVTVAVIGNDLTVDQTDLRDNAKLWLESFVQYIARYEATLQMNVEQKNLEKAEKVASKAASDLAAIDKAIQNDEKKIADKQKEIKKLEDKIKACEQEIKNLQDDIEKQNRKKGDAQKRVDDANQNVNNAQGEVDRYRQMAQ